MQGCTIAAVATASGRGGIAIVRVSGPEALPILKGCFRHGGKTRAFKPNMLVYGHITDSNGAVLDECMAVYMAAGRSYTREDVIEIHCHGGGVCARAVLERVCSLGARPAMPGEFTKRAFLNGRIDLARAEAIMQVIGANSEAALRAGVRQLEGGVSAFVGKLCSTLTALLAGIEAATDFPEEIDEQEAAGNVLAGIDSAVDTLNKALDERGARILREGVSIVLSGRPNVGKSSLMNALLNRERAIVTNIPGTTRDVLTERVQLGGIWAEISDTAGLRRADDPIEQVGVALAEKAASHADVLLYVLDAACGITGEDRQAVLNGDERMLVCLNKTDIPGGITANDIWQIRPGIEVAEISAQTGEGMENLMEMLARRVGAEELSQDILVSQRHIQLAQQARQQLVSARAAVLGGVPVDMCGDDIRAALESLSEITGTNAREDVIDKVFATFCVGK